MITCPTCKHKEIEGALYCSECGGQLVTSETNSTQSIRETDKLEDHLAGFTPPAADSVGSEASVSLHVLEAGQILPLVGKEDFTLGRSSDSQSMLPDIDLSCFHAFDKGVSRMHSRIRISKNIITIMDLGSVNGTRVNGKKLPPQIEQSVNNGDIITLGKLKLQILIRR